MRQGIELMADRVEAVLEVHNAGGRVFGGSVTPRWVRFDVAPLRSTRIDAMRRLAPELAAALGVSNVRVSQRGAVVAVEVPRDDAQPVRLLPLMWQIDDRIPPVTALLGLADDGAPLLVRLPSPDVAHVLVSGTTGSGKTVLLRSMTLSLALYNSRSRLSLVLIGAAFDAFSALPHLVHPVVRRAEEAVEVLRRLVALMDARDAEGVTAPAVVVVIDELADLLMVEEGAVKAMTRLVQRGRNAGIHVVAATQKPTAAVVGSLVKANFPVRVVGKVSSANDARVAAGWSGTGAERLEGRGDFIVVAEGRVSRFQAAHVTESDVTATLEREGLTEGVTVSGVLSGSVSHSDTLPAPPPPESDTDAVAEVVEELEAMGWDASRSVRAACRALGRAEGGNSWSTVAEAVEELRKGGATATATVAQTSERRGGDGQTVSSDGRGRGRNGWLWFLEQEGAL